MAVVVVDGSGREQKRRKGQKVYEYTPCTTVNTYEKGRNLHIYEAFSQLVRYCVGINESCIKYT